MVYHITEREWLFTPDGQPRGYIQPQYLRELWFHTGTICNLSCSFCLEGSSPGDRRIEMLQFTDARPFIDEARELGVEQFSFTGGEPFVIRDIFEILDYALSFRPCLVLTNGTKPLMVRKSNLLKLREKPFPLKLRISLDFPHPREHDANRGRGNFHKALEALVWLHQQGFGVSVARRMTPGENPQEAARAYQQLFASVGLPSDLHIVAFPEYCRPGSAAETPHITETCMTRYKDARSRAEFMCNFSKMVVKQQGKMRVYACTLVDDDARFNLGATLQEAMPVRVMLNHHRCYTCFTSGASCSELSFSANNKSRKVPNVVEHAVPND